MKTDFRQALTSDRLVLTAECAPPRSAGPEAVTRLATAFPSVLDAVVVADNPDGIHGSAVACAALLAREEREVILSMSTRDRNRIALESDALGASALGVSTILCLSGNHQSLGACPQAAGVHDLDSIQLTRALMTLDIPDLLVGAVAHPYLRPLELNLLRLKKKVAAGAEFLLTQPVFDIAAFSEWMGAVREAGLDGRVAIIASVLPFPSAERAAELRDRQTYGPLDEAVVARVSDAADPAKEGLAMAAEVIGGLKAMPGIRGIHILCGGFEAAAGELIQAAGLT